jgi:hypothetical protein
LKFHVYFSVFGFSPGRLPWQCTSEKGKKVPGEKLPALIPNPDLFLLIAASSFEKISPACQGKMAGNVG